MKLKIILSSWSKWVKDYKPVETEKEYDIKLNEKYIVEVHKNKELIDGNYIEKEEVVFSFSIVEVNETSIKIHTYQDFIGGREFIININNPIRIVTPTRDAGYVYILSLIK